MAEREGEAYVIWGGGVTGFAAAYALSKQSKSPIVLVEKSAQSGGLAGAVSDPWNMGLDLGSHRIHANYHKVAFEMIRELLGDQLLERERHGRIHIHGQYLKYPPSLFEVMFAFGWREGLRMGRDYLLAAARRKKRVVPASFESYAIDSVGTSLYEKFFASYARKLWSIPASEISYEAAQSRVQKLRFFQSLKRLLRFRPKRYSFFYPEKGFAQITRRLEEEFIRNGGTVVYAASLSQLKQSQAGVIEEVEIRHHSGESQTIAVKAVIATVPLDVLRDAIDGEAKSSGLSFRALRLVYLKTPHCRVSPHETHYFPDDAIFGRVSEPAKYTPHFRCEDGRTLLVLEIPCSQGDAIWNMDFSTLVRRCLKDLFRLHIIHDSSAEGTESFEVKIPSIYPVYAMGWREKLKLAMAPVDAVKNLFPIGRSALFLHCNLDHCIVMAVNLSQFLLKGGRKAEWLSQSENFQKFALHD